MSAQFPRNGAQALFLLPRPATEGRMAMTARLMPARGGKTIAQFRACYGISERNWKRLKADGDIPRLTWITSAKAIIRQQHEDEWLDARTDPGPEPSPFPADEN
jgi:hypothetical protein